MADVGDNVILSWVGELDELEQQIEDLQTAKRDFYAAIRDQHGKPTAAGLKAAMRVHRMDSEKRLAADEVSDEAERILAVIEKGPSRTRAPRATREEAAPGPAAPPHDPETGEVEEPVAPAEPTVEAPVAPAPLASVEPAAAPAVSTEAVGSYVPPTFLAGERKSIRPHCQRPENCGGYGREHCYECKKVASSKEAA